MVCGLFCSVCLWYCCIDSPNSRKKNCQGSIVIKNTCKSCPTSSEGGEIRYSLVAKLITWSQINITWFSVTDNETKGKNSFKWAAAKIIEELVFEKVHRIQTLGCFFFFHLNTNTTMFGFISLLSNYFSIFLRLKRFVLERILFQPIFIASIQGCYGSAQRQTYKSCVLFKMSWVP